MSLLRTESKGGNMGVILKHTFRNIFAKPLMTIFLVVSITICAFAGMLAFDMSNSLDNILKGLFSSVAGTSNVLVDTKTEIKEEDFEGLPEYEGTFVSSKTSKITVRNKQMYAYYNQKNLSISGVDSEIAANMRLIPKDTTLTEDECIITDVMAKELKLKEGDTFTIYGDNYIGADYKIKKIAKLNGLLSNDYSAVVSKDGMAKLCYDGKPKCSVAYIKVKDEAKLNEFCDTLEERFPTYEVENLVSGKLVKDQIEQISSVFMMLFLITLLLVIFVTITLSERIMIDRMSTVGTLRSLGVSPKLTARVILIENMFYGLFGGVIGTVLYVVSRDAIFNNVFTVNTGTDMEVVMDLGKVSIPVMISVIIGAVVVEMLCPLRELLKATNTAIRDIIFDNKDTEYKYKKKNFVIAVISAVSAVVMGVLAFTVLDDNPIISLLAFIFTVLAFFSGYSFVLRTLSRIFERLSQRLGGPILGLAATNLRTKKTSIGSSKLAFIATSLCLVLFIVITSFENFIDNPPADATVILNGLSEKAESYDYISDLEGVSDIEFEYTTYDKMIVGTEKIDEYFKNKYEKKYDDELTNISILGAEGNPKLSNGYKGIPDVVKSDEIYLGKNLAKELNLKEGDTAEILLNPLGVVPYRGTFKVAGIIDSSMADDSNKTIVFQLDVYKQVYFDKPATAYIKAENPEKTVELIKSYSSSTINKINTMDDYMKEQKNQSAGMMTLLYMIIIMGVALSLIGVFSNQIVGFESRKRESAVLVSTSMSRSKLVKLFFDENMLSSSISIVLGTLVGAVETIFTFKALESLMAVNPVINYGKTIIFLILMFITFSITILKTMRNIKKMKISEQLKYE